uniref:CCHC-type domain-containing protein n=1 Tax=Caenorhabditis japonica TaxID=281687 RepID=A0A8R1ES03_CAEJA
MMRMFEKQIEQHQAAMTALVQAMTSKSNDESRADMTPTTSGVSQTQLMNDIGSRVAMFQFDLKQKRLSQSGTLVTRRRSRWKGKISRTRAKMKFTSSILKEFARESTLKWKELVFAPFAASTLLEMMNTCGIHDQSHSMCESAMLQDIDAEGWKVFFWLKGLDASRDKSARTYFIRYVEQKWEKKEPVNVNDLCEEWKKLLRQNSVVQEMEQVDKAVRALHTKKDFNRNHKKLWNREQSNGKVDECWNCGKVGHRKPDCVQRLTKCLKCQKTGHLSKYCKSKGSKKAQSMVVIESAAAEDVEVNAVRQYVMVEVNDQLIEFQLDTGSDITLISRKDWMKVGEPELEKCPMKVKSASGNEVKLLGRAKVDFMLKGSAASA